MKKAILWILGILLSPVLLFAVLVLLLYLPPVQNWAVDKVAAIASEKTGMDISVGHVNLSFPLDLEITDFKADSIAAVQRMVVDVQLMPLIDSRVVINELEVSGVRLNTGDLVEAARVKGSLGRLFLKSDGIDLDKQTVLLNGARIEDAQIDVQLNDSVPEDTTTTPTLWRIDADSIVVSRSDLVLHMPGDTMQVAAHLGSLTARQAMIDLGTETYTVGSVDWVDGALKYDLSNMPNIEGLDMNHLDLSNIRIGIDSIYYHDPTLRLYMREVALKEKSGLAITELSGAVSMENGSIRLPRFRLKTPESDIYVEMDMPLSLTDSIDPGKMRLRLDAQIGREDVMRFMSDMPPAFRQHWPYYPLSVKGTARGNMEYLEFDDLDVALPTVFYGNATGFVANVTNPAKLRADVQFKARTQNLACVMAMLPRDMQRDYRLPPISAEGRVKADGARYFADVTAREGRGLVKVKGNFNADAMRYDATMTVRDLNVHHFMPRDSIYTITANVNVQGQGTDFLSPRTTLKADATIDRFQYGQWDLTGLTVQADVHDGHAYSQVESHNQLVNGKAAIDALMNTTRLEANISAELHKVDLYAMKLVEKPLSIGLCGQMDVTSDMKLTHYVSGLFSDLAFRDSVDVVRPEFIGLHIRTSEDTTLVRAQSGDLILKLDASGDYEKLTSNLMQLTDSLSKQLERNSIDQKALRDLLPNMKMHLESKRDNPLVSLLQSQGLDYKELLFDMSMSATSGLNGNGHLHSLVVSDVRLDTINFRLNERNERLSFGGQIRNNRKNPQFVFNAQFDGILQQRGATVGVRYYDADNRLGARLGVQAEMVDTGGVMMHLVPERPTLGYKEFNLNKDNFLYIAPDNKVKAKIDLIADDKTGLKLYSEADDPTNHQDITVSLHRVNLAEITSVLPYMPKISGLLNGDYHVVQDANGRFSVAGDMSVQKMTYEQSPIGNISTELVYLEKGDSAHAIEARLTKDNVEVGLITGTYYDKNGGRIDAKFQMERFPLDIANGFVPDQMIGLEGYGKGEMTIKGSLDKPVVNGEILLDSSYLVSIPYGVKLRFADKPVYINQSQLELEDFTVYAQLNNSPLTVNGNINFSDLENIMVNLRMRARDYQIIGAKENPNSVAYGKAFVNMFARLKGPLDNLDMRGRLEVLGSTDLSYVLRDSPLTTDNRLDELVKFTDFTDSTQAVVTRPQLTGFTMDMTVEVSKGAHVMAYLNADHSNYIDLMGGGTLRMLYSPSEDLRLTGKYTLSNGEMKYSLPVIPLKTFHIQDGSYIEFNGEMMNPTLNITATERTKATVTNASGVGRSVEFDCGVIITKTLNDMGLEFTLDAPEDMSLHSELQSLSVEQRGKLAVTMLTTGMYLDDGSTQGFSMNSALSSFLNSEINSITGNALRSLDLSFGMDNSMDATGQQRTDYSFKFAKRFLNNRLKVAVGGKVSTGAELQDRNKSFFDNVSLEYRLDNTANKYLSLYFQNNSYDWLDGYTQKYGGGFIWRRTLQHWTDFFRFKDTSSTLATPRAQTLRNDSTRQQVQQADSLRQQTVKNDSTTQTSKK